MTPIVPLLAPFLDRMIDPNVSSRLTAADAVKNFSGIIDLTDISVMKTAAPTPPKWTHDYVWQAYDRWANLPETFTQMAGAPPVRPRRKIQQPDGNSFFID